LRTGEEKLERKEKREREREGKEEKEERERACVRQGGVVYHCRT